MKTTIVVALLMSILPPRDLLAAEMVQVDQPAICYRCHADIENLASKRHVHEVFREGVCSECHNPHASRHATLLSDDLGAVCDQCHADVETSRNLSSGHDPAARGKCDACHDPHASDEPRLLRLPSERLCESCHSAVESWTDQPVVHAPVSDDCSTCHQPHGSQFEGLLNESIPALCFECHENDTAFQSTHRSAKISETNCTTCHSPHASSRRALLRKNEHSPFAADRCDACHDRTGAEITFSVQSVSSKCSNCHPEANSFAKFKFRHNLSAPKSCAQCHNPHASDQSSLLKAPQEKMCASCHFDHENSPDDVDMTTHTGTDCSECHLPHGANNSRYLKAGGGPELCTECHSREGHTSHPVGEAVVDPRTEEAVTCLSCHKLHGAGFEKYLPLDPGRELGIQCHRK
jgi:predicted CXXCH cytochrome family protein